MIDLGLDFETFYDQDYSLKKLDNAQYVMDGRFESMGFSMMLPEQKPVWITGDFAAQKEALSRIPWDKVRVVSHNARFDGSILEWRFGFKPAAYLCTMVGSRPHFVPKTGSMALDAIGNHLGLPAKGDAVHEMLGRRRSDLTPAEMAAYGEYCCTDTAIAMGIAKELNRILPPDERDLIDATLKKYLRPRLLLDGRKLIARLTDLNAERTALLAHIKEQYGVEKDQLTSAPKFASVLEARGVTAPMKMGKPGKKNPQGKLTFAFAKDDLEFKNLLIHPDMAVRELCNAKMTVGSSQEQSRLRRLLDLHNVMNGKLPVPMVYYGAHTGRFSGDESINLQNLPRVEKNADGIIKKGHLRYTLIAPPGYTVVAADFSNIEARIVATLARQMNLVQGFARGEDIYSWFASLIYSRPINKRDHPVERFVGKTCILGLGYGLGWKMFLLKMLQSGISMDEREAKRIVYLYRETYACIPELWKAFDQLAGKYLIDPTGLHVWRRLTFAHERIILPNGMPIQYPDLAMDQSKGLYFRSRKYKALDSDGALTYEKGNKIWGGAFTENVSQGLARIIATSAELRLQRLGLPAALQAHDELVWSIPSQLVEISTKAIEFEMTRPVEWMPDLPIAVEIKHGPTYGDAK